jgi:hypothetical protein
MIDKRGKEEIIFLGYYTAFNILFIWLEIFLLTSHDAGAVYRAIQVLEDCRYIAFLHL